jgi:hypothetical protein
MMNLTQLIDHLTALCENGSPPPEIMHNARVVVKCPVPNVDGWLAPANITVVNPPDSGEETPIVRIEGGFGA